MTGPAALATAGLILALAAVVLAVAVGLHGAGHHVSDRQIRRLCATYAGLDLMDLAPICEQVGYQQEAP